MTPLPGRCHSCGVRLSRVGVRRCPTCTTRPRRLARLGWLAEAFGSDPVAVGVFIGAVALFGFFAWMFLW